MEPWTRLHDDPNKPVSPQPAQRFHPTARDWAELVRIVNQAEKEHHEVRASGSHWALSHAAVTDGFQVETHDPNPDPNSGQFQPLNETLYDVIPGCLSLDAKRFLLSQKVKPWDPKVPPDHNQIYLYHVEAGIRIFELYDRLDQGDEMNSASLVHVDGFDNYKGPWAMQTLGGAGGQTIVGALCTGTHGGDVYLPPIADAVQALHLIGAGGRQFWIEKQLGGVNLVDDNRLKATYPGIEILRDPDVFNSVIVAAGRMGIIYSVVLRVVRQFALKETRVESTWNDVRKWLTVPTDPMFGQPSGTTNRFVSVILSPNSQVYDKNQHTCYVTTRDLVRLQDAPPTPNSPPPPADFYGRNERRLGGHAGNSYALEAHGSFRNAMCESDSPLHAGVSIMIGALISYRNYWIAAAVGLGFLFPAGAMYARAMVVAAELAIMDLDALRARLPRGPLGTTLAAITNWAAETDHFEVLRRLNGIAFEQDQTPRALTAISYAVMDIHDYRGDSCIPWGDSLEVFFEASDANILRFVENLLARIAALEGQRLGFGGYVAIRFMKKSEGLIAMQKWDRTCSLEIAGIGEVHGTEPFLRDTERDAVALHATVHWGQRNNLSMKDVEAMYDADAPSGALFRWRKTLSELTRNGRLATFSTDFTRRRGLEVVQPLIEYFTVAPTYGCVGAMTRITWNAADNPPGTLADLVVSPINSPGTPSVTRLGGLLGSRNDVEVPIGGSGFALIISRELNGRTLTATASHSVIGVQDHEVLSRVLGVSCTTVDGEPRWGAQVSFDEQFGEEIAVEELYARFNFRRKRPSTTGELALETTWACRRDGLEQLVFSRLMTRHPLPSLPKLRGTWTFFVQGVEGWGCPGAPPSLTVEFKLVCGSK